MAGSRRSPVLRDERRVAKEPRERSRDRDLDLDRDREREKGRDRNRDREHRPRFRQGGSDRRPRSSPPSRRGPPPDHDSAGNYRHPSPTAPAGRELPTFPRSSQPSARGRSPPKRAPHPARDIERSPPTGEKAPRRDSSAAPPSKRKRTRSPSPEVSHRETPLHNRHPHHIESHRRGRRDNRGKPPSSRDPFPRRSRKEKPYRQKGQKNINSREEVGDSRPSKFRRSRSPHRRRSRSRPPHHSGFESHLQRPSSPHSVHSRRSGSLSPSRDPPGPDRNMNSTRPIRSIVDDSSRPPSPPRPIPSFDADNGPDQVDGESRIREAFPMHGMRASEMQSHQRRGPPRPRVDTRQYTSSPQFVTPTSSYHGSPQSGGSPYSGGRGGWNGQTPFAGQHG
jgi:CTD kinase subunit alpha